MTAHVNRQHRRHARAKTARAARKICGSDATLPPVEDFRASDGKVAISIDIAGLDPTTLQIDVSKLGSLVDGMDRLFGSMPYQQVLWIFTAAYRDWKHGKAEYSNACLAVFWLALRHPASRDSMRAAISHALRRNGRAHITFHGGRERGIAFALAPQFCDLGECLEAAKTAAGGVVVVQAERDAETFQ